jgi:hypothetical protein
MSNGNGKSRSTKHLVVLRFDPSRPGGPWRLFVFEDDKRLFRLDYRQEKPAVFMAAKLVDDIRKNGWPCRWVVQDEDGQPTGMDLREAARRMRVQES